MHLAESPEELELLRSAGGPFAQRLQAIGAWDAASDARLPRILEYLQQLARAPRSAGHPRQLSRARRDRVPGRARRHDVGGLLPRTHRFFGHAHYPLAEMLSAGVSFALGTDSREFEPRSRPAGRNVRRLRAASGRATRESSNSARSAASAAGRSDRIGSIEPGKQADFAVVRLPESEASDPHQLLFDSRSRVEQTWVRGRQIATAGSS